MLQPQLQQDEHSPRLLGREQAASGGPDKKRAHHQPGPWLPASPAAPFIIVPQGTVAIKKLLFDELQGNGWYYGSDGVRSPLHFMRNPGEPAYDGVVPPEVLA